MIKALCRMVHSAALGIEVQQPEVSHPLLGSSNV